MPFKTPAVSRSSPTAPVINSASPTAPTISRTSPTPVKYYSDGNLGEAGPGVYGGFIPEPTPPPVATGWNAGFYDDGTYDS